MIPRNLDKSNPDQLAQLMSIDGSSPLGWSEEDLRALLNGMLDSPVEAELMSAAKSPEAQRQLNGYLAGHPAKSLADLLLLPGCPLDIVNLLKAHAKDAQAGKDPGIPREIGVALYYAAIASALVQLNARTTQLGNEDLAAGLEWVLQRPWLDERLTPLFKNALLKTQGNNR